jgi:tRNA(His) 5'-end guanylyltransferase
MKIGNRGRRTNENGDKEIYAEIKAHPPLIVRADGRDFKGLLTNFEKPYDERFAAGMVKATEIFFERSGFDPKLAYTFSDEINLFFTHVPFKGRIEKLDSVIAGFLASALTIALDFKEALAFDARVIPVCRGEEVWDYLVQRQAEAWRNHLNAYGYYELRAAGLSEEEAEEQLKGMKAMEVHELLFRRGINLNETPKWQRRGILIAKERYEKEGYNPRTAKRVTATRYRVVQLWDLPLFGSEEGRTLIENLI